MIRTLEAKNVDGRQVLGIFQGSQMVCEVKSTGHLGAAAQHDKFVYTKAIDIAARTATGVFSVMGVVDSTKDRIHEPAFTKTIDERLNKGKKVRFLWNHDQMNPPVATVKSARVLTRTELPAEVLSEFPDATGGAEITRLYHDFPLAEAVFKNIQSDGLNEMSFGFIPINFAYTKEADDDPMWKAIREIYELKLYEVSDVQWGANPATMAVREAPPPFENWKHFVSQLKSSKALSEDDKTTLREGYDLLKAAFEAESAPTATGDASVKADGATEPKEGETPPAPPQAVTASEFSLQMQRAKSLILNLGGH